MQFWSYAYDGCPSFWLAHQKNPCYRSIIKICQHQADIFHKMHSFKISIGCYPSFGLCHQKNPCYRSLMKICQHGAKIFNKMCSFEVKHRVVAPHFVCLIKRILVIEALSKSVNIELRHLTRCAVLKLAQGCYPSSWLCHWKNPCYISLMIIYYQDAEIFNKMCSFEISIGCYPSFGSSHQKNHCYRSLMKIFQHGAKIFNKHAVLKLP